MADDQNSQNQQNTLASAAGGINSTLGNASTGQSQAAAHLGGGTDPGNEPNGQDTHAGLNGGLGG